MSVFHVESLEQQKLKEPFQFALPPDFGVDTVFEMQNPEAMDWRDVAEIDTLPGDEQMSMLLGDQYDEFAAIDGINGRMVRKIMDGWRKHFGLGSGTGEARGSRQPSNGTGPR